jgi:hypothetical protein
VEFMHPCRKDTIFLAGSDISGPGLAVADRALLNEQVPLR